MKKNQRPAFVILCVSLVAFAIGKMVKNEAGRSGADRDLLSFLVCEGCGTITAAGPDFVAENYAAGTVRMVGVETRFACPSCGAKDGRLETLEFTATHIRCSKCGAVLCENGRQAMKLFEHGGMRMGEDKQLEFKCNDCGEFAGRMVSHNDP